MARITERASPGATDEIATLLVADVMTRWPATVAVFHRRRMACPGCVMAPFMTVREAAKEYGFPLAELAADLIAAMAGEGGVDH